MAAQHSDADLIARAAVPYAAQLALSELARRWARKPPSGDFAEPLAAAFCRNEMRRMPNYAARFAAALAAALVEPKAAGSGDGAAPDDADPRGVSRAAEEGRLRPAVLAELRRSLVATETLAFVALDSPRDDLTATLVLSVIIRRDLYPAGPGE